MDLASFRGEGSAVNTREKIVPLAEIAARAQDLAKPETKFIVVAGCFDLLSRELVQQLQSARSENAVLVAAVDPKSESEPQCLLPADARAQLAAGLASVDWVVVGSADAAKRALKHAEILDASSDLAPRLLARFRGGTRA